MSGFLRRLLGPRSRGGSRRVAEPRLTDVRLVANEPQPGPALAESDLPRTSIVVLNYNGRHHLAGCFESLRELDHPSDRLEVVLVDNGSSDGSVEEVRAEFAWVKLVENERNAGFSGGCNQGARTADAPDVLVFLNNDMRVRPDFLRELVSPIARGECQATTAKMLSWDGKRINSAGGGMNFHGIGIQKGYEEDPGPEHDRPSHTLFACGGAMAIAADVFFDVGGFDEEFFAYYEDVDLGWRLWVLGHTAQYVPTAVCYHHHSSTSRTFPKETIRLLQVRNPLLACFKNYDDENLARVLPAGIALAVRRMLLVSGIDDDTPFRIERLDAPDSGVVGRLLDKAKRSVDDHIPIRRVAAADLIGLNDLLGNWEHWVERRKEVQDRRRRADEEIFQLFHKPMWCIEEEDAYRELHYGIARHFGIDRMFEGLTHKGPEPKK
ncbi:MAG: glycosyltransferase family 2 protein [Planctomycetota bacterium]|nr:glycosyltransferase family 2 protein [Planctomycetota bacterium]